jgi:hypothetical protein
MSRRLKNKLIERRSEEQVLQEKLRSKDKTKPSREGFQRGGIFYRKGR